MAGFAGLFGCSRKLLGSEMAELSIAKKIARLLGPLILVSILVAVLSIASDLSEISLLEKFQSGSIADSSEMDRLAASNDNRQAVISYVELSVFATTLVSFFVWLNQSNKLARAAGAQGLRFSPGWTVGYFFIPIINLWKPYQAVADIWKASKNPKGMGAAATGDIVVIWWIFFLVSSAASNAAFRLALKAEEIDELIRSGWVSCLSSGLDIVYYAITLVLVREINRGLWVLSDLTSSGVE